MLRSVLTVVGGFLLIGALAFGGNAILIRLVPGAFDAAGTTRDPALLVLLIVYVAVVATFGCWVTARLAPSRPMAHALVLGALGLVFNVVNTVALWNTAPAWFHVISLLLVMPAAWLGGMLAARPRAAAFARA